MKKRLLFWMAALLVAIGGVQQAFAQASYNHTYKQGVVVAEGSDYFLYNIGTGMFLTDGMDYGTHGSVDHAGRVITLTANGDGYRIYTRPYSANGSDEKAGYVCTDGYIDETNVDAGRVGNWVFTPVNVDGYTNAYTIKNSDTQYLYYEVKDGLYQGKMGAFINVGNNTGNSYSYWLIIPKSARDAVKDCTYYLRNTDMTHPWEFPMWNSTGVNVCVGSKENVTAEAWHTSFDFSQTISAEIPNGKYSLHCQGYYYDTETPTVLYANDDRANFAIWNNDCNAAESGAKFLTGAYDGNVVTTVVTNGSLKVGVTDPTVNQNWQVFDNFYLEYLGQTLSTGVAIALPEGGAMEANQWYYFEVSSDNTYSFTTTTSADIIFTADGTLLESEANAQAAALPSGNQELTAGRYYIKSSSANNFKLDFPKPTAEQITQLRGLITAGEEKTLGFDNGEFAPYNNVAAILALADAKTLNLDNPNQYTESFILGKIAALQTWTANTAEVNALAYGDLSQYETVDGKDYPLGWKKLNDGSRIMGGSEGTNNAGLSATSKGKAMLLKYNAKYGEVAGYTMPLKANTYYKISFKYCGWNNTPTTNVVLTGPNGGVTVTPASFRPETSDGHSNASDWYTYTAIFKTGADAGNYTLALNKVETGQQQIGWSDMVLVRAKAEDLTYTLETGAMNAGVAAAQQTAAETFEADETFVNYEALLTAIEAAKTSEAEYVLINNRINLLKAQLGDIPVADAEADAFVTNYANGVYENLGQVIPAYQTFVQNYWATNVAEGKDLTAFVINPSLNFGDATGWSGGGVNNGTIEWFNGNYNVFQTLSGLPNGTYKLQAQGYYRPGGNENASTAQNALLYGGTTTQPVVLIASEGKSEADADNGFTTKNTNSGSEVYVPNSQADAAKAFATGAYENEVTFVVSNGTVNIGFKKDVLIANDWTCFDNFKLIYESEDALVAPEMPTEQMYAGAKAEMQAALATWTADKSTDNYNALVEKINAANQSVELYKQIKARLDLLTSAGQRGSISEEAEKAMSFYTKYSDGMVNETADVTTGSYTSLDEVVPEYQANIAAYWTANAPAADDDLTSLITNNSFEFGNLDTWAHYNGGDSDARENANATYTIDIADGNYVANFWNNNADVKYIVKDIALPNGTYELKAIFASDEGVTINFTAESGIGADNRIGEVRNTFTTEAAKGVGAEKTLEVVVHNGTLRLGANTTSWFKVDNFRLIYKSADATVAPALAEGHMSQTAKQAMLDAQATYDTTKSVENYNALLARIDEAKQSIAVYEQIANTLAKLTENANQRGDIDETTEKAMTFYTNYSAGQVNGATDATTGTYETLDDMIAQYRTDIANYWTTNAPAAGADLTAYIVNQGFEFGNVVGWEEENKGGGVDAGARDAHNETYMFSDSEGDFIFNSWNNNWAEITLTQTLNGVPQGTYELTAVFAAEGFNNIEFIGTNIREDSTEDETADKFRPVDINQRADKKTGLTRTIEVFVTDGKLKINGNTWGFFKADNFRLVYKSATIADPDLTQPMNLYEKNDYLAAKAAYEANSSQENLREWAASKIIVENSIKAYKAAKKTLDHVKDMMDHTNVYTYDAFFTIDDMYRKYGPEEGFYGFRTLEDDVAYDLERMFFGNGNYRDSNNENIPAVPFIASAWDCGHNGYAYVETGPGKEGTEPGSDYYGNTWSREGLDDGTNMLTPYLEYWRNGDQLLNPRVLTATVEGTPNAEYTVKMFIRVRTNVQYEEGNESTKPHGMTIQIGDGAKFTPNWQYVDNEGTQYVLNNARQLWVCNLWLPAHQGDANNASYLLPKGNADAEGNFKIKFEIEEGSNVTWLSMKDVYVNYETEVPATEMAALKAQIDYADAHKLGFDFNGDEHGTAVDEYAPYNNVPQLMALKRAKQVHDSPQNVFLVRNVTKALKAVNYDDENMDDLHPVYNEATDLWTKNTEEMNGFYWKNDYTNSDVEHIEWYEYEDDCIMPSGWDLIGRNDGFNTGIKKLGVNTEDTGMKALEDQTGLLAKYETDYGNQIGYTLPLKKGVKYIMTFKYAYMGEGTCTEPTDITLTVPAAGVTGDDTENSGLEVTTFTPEGQGTEDLGKWKMYRATFTPTIENEEHPGEPVNYLITFDKDNAHDPVPIIMGELTLVRYKEAAALGNNILIDGTNQAGYSYTPDFVGGDFKVTRSWNNGGETGAYNTLVLPFSLDGSELKTALGPNFNGKVYFYTGATYTGGDEYYTLNFDERENSGIFANVPVLIWNEKANSINNLTNYEFKNTVTKYVKNDLTVDPGYNDDTKYKYNLVGTYETIKIPAGASYITADNNFKKSTGKANLAATRAYFIPLDKDGNVSTMAKLMGFRINDIPTGIMAIEEDGEMHVTSGNIYTVDGRLVRQNATSLEDLPKGIYIVDGKKYFVK